MTSTLVDPHRGPTFLVLTEDGAKSAVATVVAITRSLCNEAAPGIDDGALHFEPPVDGQRRALSGNRWKCKSPSSADDQRAITELIRTIATQLGRPGAFVVFHFDGDRPYGKRTSAENPQKFQKQIYAKVRELLRLPPKPATTSRQPRSQERTNEEVDEMMSKLIILTPFYSMESWTYYNTAVLRPLCGPQEQAKVDRWATDPSQIEEIEQIGKQLFGKQLSAGKDHNQRLAEQSFPSAIAVQVGKSFADTVKLMRTCAPLMDSLNRIMRSRNWSLP